MPKIISANTLRYQDPDKVRAGQVNSPEVDCVISAARKEGRTKAFNLNSLLIKPVQRITKYPLLLQQVYREIFLMFLRCAINGLYAGHDPG